MTALLDEALKIVNAPAAIGEDFDFEEFRTGVEDALEKGEEAMSVLRGVLEKGEEAMSVLRGVLEGND